MDLYRCDACNLEQEDSDDFEETCSQCGTIDQFYLVDELGSESASGFGDE